MPESSTWALILKATVKLLTEALVASEHAHTSCRVSLAACELRHWKLFTNALHSRIRE